MHRSHHRQRGCRPRLLLRNPSSLFFVSIRIVFVPLLISLLLAQSPRRVVVSNSSSSSSSSSSYNIAVLPVVLTTLLSSCVTLLTDHHTIIIRVEGAAAAAAAAATTTTTYYDVLEIKRDATLQDIKKAYRRLAVQHHPDRNIGNEEEATVKFREISEAYEILSNEESRRQYDASLKVGGGDRESSFHSDPWSYDDYRHQYHHQYHQQRHYRDPFAQFNDVFQNDPFFAEAFRSLDDLFDTHFAGSSESSSTTNFYGSQRTRQGGKHNNNNNRRRQRRGDDNDNESKIGQFLWNTVKRWLPNIEISTTTTTSNFGGGRTSHYSSTSRKYGDRSSSSSSSSSSSANRQGGTTTTYTSRSTRTIIQNGQRITIQSLEKDGNKIEEKYVGEKLIERTINGKQEDIGRILSSSRGGGAANNEF